MTVLLRRAGSVAANLAHRLALSIPDDPGLVPRPGAVRARSTALSVVFALAALGIAGCVDSAIRPAPFRTRPDAAEPGSLQGPFDGRVVDSTTHAPIAGARVYGGWTSERAPALADPAGAKEFVGSTDAAGNYKVPRLDRMSRGTRVT